MATSAHWKFWVQISSLCFELVANAGEDQGSKQLVDGLWTVDKSKIALAPEQSPLVALTNSMPFYDGADCLELYLKSQNLLQLRGMFVQIRQKWQGHLCLGPSCGEHQMVL